MKKIFSLILSVGLLAAVSVNAQSPTYAWQTVSLATIAADSNTNYASPVFIDCSKQGNIAFQLNPTSNTGTSNVVYRLALTVDGTLYDTNHSVALTAPCNMVTVTNVSCPGLKGFYLWQATNNFVAGIVTNNFKYSVKISAP